MTDGLPTVSLRDARQHGFEPPSHERTHAHSAVRITHRQAVFHAARAGVAGFTPEEIFDGLHYKTRGKHVSTASNRHCGMHTPFLHSRLESYADRRMAAEAVIHLLKQTMPRQGQGVARRDSRDNQEDDLGNLGVREPDSAAARLPPPMYDCGAEQARSRLRTAIVGTHKVTHSHTSSFGSPVEQATDGCYMNRTLLALVKRVAPSPRAPLVAGAQASVDDGWVMRDEGRGKPGLLATVPGARVFLSVPVARQEVPCFDRS